LDRLRPKDCTALIAVLSVAAALVRIQIFGKMFASQAISPNVSMVKLEPGGAMPPNDHLAILRAKERPNPWEKSATMQHIDPGTIRLSRRQELILPLFKSLGSNLALNQMITDLRLVGLKVPAEGWKWLSRGLKANRSLEYLSLNYCRIRDEEIAILSPAIERCVHLRKLDLSNNSLGNKSGFHLARIISLHSLHKDESIWRSSLRGGDLSSEEGNFLQEVCLANNQLDDFAVFELCRALGLDCWVRALDLRRNKVGAEALKAIWSVLRSNEHLLVVDVRETPAEDLKEVALIVAALQRNFTKAVLPPSRRRLYQKHLNSLSNKGAVQRLSAPVSPKLPRTSASKNSLSPNSTACSPPSSLVSARVSLKVKGQMQRSASLTHASLATQASYRSRQQGSKLDHLEALAVELSGLLAELGEDLGTLSAK